MYSMSNSKFYEDKLIHMLTNTFPRQDILLDVDQLVQLQQQSKVQLVDLSDTRVFAAEHIPEAVNFDRNKLKKVEHFAQGKLIELCHFNSILKDLGLLNTKKIVVYDDSKNMWATRFLWTLDLIGYKNYALLDGALPAWKLAEKQTTTALTNITVTDIKHQLQGTEFNDNERISKNALKTGINNGDIQIWDARSKDEYTGMVSKARFAGHMPKAIHLEWTALLSEHMPYTIRPDIKAILTTARLQLNKPTVTHCQSHLRSSVTWFIGKLLDMPIKAYDGGWSEWGNCENCPHEKS